MTEKQILNRIQQKSEELTKLNIRNILRLKDVKEHFISNLSKSILSLVSYDDEYNETIDSLPIELYIDQYLLTDGAIYTENQPTEHEPTKHQTPTKNYKDMSITEKNDYFDNHTLEEFKRFKGDI